MARTEPTPPTKITLLSFTQHPLETVYGEWVQSRTTDPVLTASEYVTQQQIEDGLEARILEVFQQVVAMKMPLGETVDFVFLLENMSIALREQIVRHRVGHKFGDRLGADIIPDLAGTSSFWSQTTRILDSSEFATAGRYLTPQWLEEHGEETMPGFNKGNPKQQSQGGVFPLRTISEFYHEQMKWIQAAYRRLLAAGMPLEDARNILPVAMTHRMTWKTNLSAIMHVLSRRGCWLAQLGMWEPVIKGIVDELATKIHPTFRKLIDPPCIGKNGEFEACVFDHENGELMSHPEYPPCSLWINRSVFPTPDATTEANIVGIKRLPRYRKMQEKYSKLWGRNPVTGERKVLV